MAINTYAPLESGLGSKEKDRLLASGHDYRSLACAEGSGTVVDVWSAMDPRDGHGRPATAMQVSFSNQQDFATVRLNGTVKLSPRLRKTSADQVLATETVIPEVTGLHAADTITLTATSGDWFTFPPGIYSIEVVNATIGGAAVNGADVNVIFY